MEITNRLADMVALATGGSRGRRPEPCSASAGSASRADAAGVVAFLASQDAGFVIGQVIYAAGGQRGPIRWAS